MNKLAVLYAVVAAAHIAFAEAARFGLAKQQLAAPKPTGYPLAGVTPEIPFELPGERRTTTTTTTTAKPDSSYLPPDNTYGPAHAVQPDAVYGPPADTEPEPAPQPDAVYGPPTSKADAEEDLNTEQPSVEEQIDEERIDNGAATEVADEEADKVLVAVDENGNVIAVATAYDEVDQPHAEDADDDQQQEEVLAVEIDAKKPAGRPARLFYQRFPQGRRQRPAPLPVPERLTRWRNRN